MKVRCVSIINPATLARDLEISSIRVGEEYLVLEVIAVPDRRTKVRIHRDGELPAVWDSEMFETTDPTLPSIWVSEVSDGGILRLGPSRWLELGFWERYFDDDNAAVLAFEEDLAIILRESAIS